MENVIENEAIEITETERDNRHIRVPALHRYGNVLLMCIAAAVGAAAGVRVCLTSFVHVSPIGILECFSRWSLWLVFEFISGYFAFGDILTAAAPFAAGMSGAVCVCSRGAEGLFCILTTAAVIYGGAVSSEMSAMLRRVTGGGTIYLDENPREKYAARFLGCFAAVAAASILGAVIG